MSKAPPKSKLGEQAAETRRRLIEATLELLPKHGIHRLSLDAIARRVGMTKGAIYGSFPSKDALILAALGTRPESRPDRIAWPSGREGSVRERMRRLGEAVVESLATAGPISEASAEFLFYALRDEQMRAWAVRRGIESHAETRQRILNLFAPDELPMPVDAFALMLTSLIPGLMYRRALGTENATDEAVLALFEGLATPA